MMGWQYRAWILTAVAAALMPVSAPAAEPVPVLLATTAKYSDEMHVVDDALVADHPGHLAELLIEAGTRCGAAVRFRFVPWQRALAEVRNGDSDGAFSSSFDKDRQRYGVYPMAGDGVDTTRALKGYSYSLYVPRENGPSWNGQSVSGDGNMTIAVERGASVIARLDQLGLPHVEVADNATMLRMVAGGRVPAAAIISSAADSLLAESRELRELVVKRALPVEEKYGYVMLSKPFYAAHADVAECLWDKIRDIRATPQYAERVRFYGGEAP